MPDSRGASEKLQITLEDKSLAQLRERLKQANRVMRAANAALARDDEQELLRMGFSAEHIADLRQQGGFRPSAIKANRQTVAYLGRCLTVETS